MEETNQVLPSWMHQGSAERILEEGALNIEEKNVADYDGMMCSISDALKKRWKNTSSGSTQHR